MDQTPLEPTIVPLINSEQVPTQIPTRSSYRPYIFGIFAVILLSISGFLGLQAYHLNQTKEVIPTIPLPTEKLATNKEAVSTTLPQISKLTPGIEKYTDPLGFSFQYSSTIYYNSDSNYPNITIKTKDLNDYRDMPSGYDLDTALEDQKALNNHEATVSQDWAEKKSITFTSLGSIPAKNFLVFARFVTDDVVFNRILIFYYKNHQVIMTYSGDPIMVSSANNYTITQEYGNTQSLVWNLERKMTEQLAIDLQNHKAPQIIQQWYDEFDAIISTFKFTE